MNPIHIVPPIVANYVNQQNQRAHSSSSDSNIVIDVDPINIPIFITVSIILFVVIFLVIIGQDYLNHLDKYMEQNDVSKKEAKKAIREIKKNTDTSIKVACCIGTTVISLILSILITLIGHLFFNTHLV